MAGIYSSNGLGHSRSGTVSGKETTQEDISTLEYFGAIPRAIRPSQSHTKLHRRRACHSKVKKLLHPRVLLRVVEKVAGAELLSVDQIKDAC